MYAADIDNITVGHGLLSHFYVDDSQQVLSGHQEDIYVLTSRLTRCIDEIDVGVASNRLKLNQYKSEMLW